MFIASGIDVRAICHCSSCHLAGRTQLAGTPYADIQSAITAAADNDEIWVEQGTYALTAMINVNKKVAIYGGFYRFRNSKDHRGTG